MKLRQKKLCDICDESFSSANIARHKKALHAYCPDCKLLVTRKSHSCFKSARTISNYVPPPPNEDEQFLLIHVPVLIRKPLYKKLESGGSFWPLYDIEEEGEALAAKVKNDLKEECFTCSVSEFIDVPDDRHSCTNPNREEVVNALRRCKDFVPTDKVINDVYQKIFGRAGEPADGFVL